MPKQLFQQCGCLESLCKIANRIHYYALIVRFYRYRFVFDFLQKNNLLTIEKQ